MPTTALAEPQKRTLAGAAYDDLRRQLVSCALKPGERLRFQQLSESYGVSASTLRDALFRLVGDGLVEVEEQRGFAVAGVSRERLLDLLATRLLLEEQGIRLSIAKGGTDWEVDILSAFHRLMRASQPGTDPRAVDETWESRHAEFHRALLSACQSPLLLQMRDMIFTQGERYRRLYKKYVTAKRDHLEEHRQLLDACLRRDPGAATRLIRSHLEATVESLLACGLPEVNEAK